MYLSKPGTPPKSGTFLLGGVLLCFSGRLDGKFNACLRQVDVNGRACVCVLFHFPDLNVINWRLPDVSGHMSIYIPLTIDAT